MISIYMLLIYGARAKENIINASNLNRSKNRTRNKDKWKVGIGIDTDLLMTGIGIMEDNNRNKPNLINSTIKCIHNINQ